jgi:hypothetical protein
MTERMTPIPRVSGGRSVAAAVLQRRCACGTHTIAGATCEHCASSELLRRRPIVDESRARPLAEPRFVKDFSGVRSGTDVAHSQERARSGEPAPGIAEQTRGGEAAEGQGMCVVNEQIPRSRSGLLNGGGEVGERFDVAITWGDSLAAPRGVGMSACRCRCGEYRQFVKGHIIINGHKEDLPLHGGVLLEDNVYHEDGKYDAPHKRYGHRDEPQTMDEEYQPDRPNGCTYIGRDFPRVMIGSDTDMLFQFKGQTYDTCTHSFGPAHEWEVRYVGPIKR